MTMAQMRAQSAAANAAAAAGTTRMGALGAGIGRFAGGPVSMALAAIGVVQLADGIMTAMREIDDAAGMSQRLVGEEGYLSLIDGAKTLRSAAAGLETIQGGPSSFFVSGMRGDTTAQMENTARIWEDLQERITKESERIAKINPFGALGDFSSLTVEEFNARLETLKVNGETATSTLKMVNEELLALGQPKVIRESTTELSSITFQDLLDANAPWMGRAAMESGGPDLVRELARLQRGEELGLTPAAEAPLPLDTSVILENLFKNTPIAQNIGTGLGPYQAMMRNQGGRLTPEQSIDARAMIEEQFMMNSPELQVLNKSYPDLVQALVDQWVAFYMEGIFGEAGVATLTADMAAAVVSSQLSGLSTGLGQTNSSSERMRLIRQTQAAIANTQRETPTTTGEEALAEIEKMRFEEASKNAEAMARSDASRADTRKQGNAILTAELQRVTQQAANRGYEDTLIGYFNAASKAQVEMIMDTARTTFLAAKAKRDADLASAQSIAEAAAIMQQFEGDKTTWRTFRKAFQRAFPQKEGDWEIPKDDEADSGITLAEAKRAAAAARAGGSLVPAQMELKNATEALRKVKGHGIKYYEALADWYNAQRALRDAIASFRDTQFRLGIDLTNPLAVAKADLRKAQAKLRSDQRAGAGPDVIAQDKLDVQNQQNQVEATKFSQRFSRMQTAEQLGRISHAAYMRYLDNERERLENVKKKTHQQWEQLNQIEQAQKSMRDGFNKMFNLGDIKMPTPYEVRRYMQSTAMPVQQTNGNTTNVYIDGADLGKVYNYLTQQWGSVVMATAGTSTSKT
jgi:hypothetical protein